VAEEISSVGQLIEHIRFARSKSDKSMWFRGHGNESWKLLPGLLRQTCRTSEGSLMARFKQSAAMLLATRPVAEFDWIFLMQHHGVPTRLLDWSENPLVALYFATERDDEMDAAIWILRPTDLNVNAHIEDKSEGDYIPSFDDPVVQGYSTESIRQNQRLKLYPIATIATRNSPRIQAQLGTFTIHHNDHCPIENVGNGTHCEKYIVPKEAKPHIREELSILGINRFSLFPEMDSIGGILKGMI
jgi:hypothetical protein